MPIEDEEARQAARARLQARQKRTARGGSAASERQRSASASQTQRSSRNAQGSARRADADYSSSRSSNRPAPQRGTRQDARSRQSSQRTSNRFPNPYDDRGAAARRNRDAQGQRSAAGGQNTSILPDSVPPIFVVGLVVAIVAAFVFSVIMPNCSGRNDKTNTRPSSDQVAIVQQAASDDAAQDFKLDTSKPRQAELAKLIGDEPATKLLGKALSDFDALWIAAHPDKYEFDGIELQYKALKLAADEDDAIPFVRSYPRDYPTAGVAKDDSLALPTGSPAENVPETNIPHLYQWDQRWANTGFAGTALGLSGSGPTCLAMVRAGLTGDSSMTPYDMAVAATDFRKTVVTNATDDPEADAFQLEETETVGAILDKQGMKADYLFDGAESLGLQCSEMYPTYETIRDALVQGQVIILDIEPGHFTTTDSFVVLTGMANNGQAIMNDPYSMAHSAQLWDIDELAAASTTMFVYTS